MALEEGSPESGDEMLFRAFEMRVIGLLWCEGDALDKAVELYDNMQDHNQPKIAANDKDFKPNFFKAFDLATDLIIKNDVLYGPNKGKEPMRELMDEDEKAEKYDEVAEEFLDTVFGP